MSTAPDMSRIGLQDLERIEMLFSLLAERVQRHPNAKRWLADIADILAAERQARLHAADRLLGGSQSRIEPPEQHVHLGALDTAELDILHGALSKAADGPGEAGRWLTKLLRLVCDELERREAAQDDFAPDDPNAALHRAQAAAMDAELERQRREKRPESDLSGLPSWREASEG